MLDKLKKLVGTSSAEKLRESGQEIGGGSFAPFLDYFGVTEKMAVAEGDAYRSFIGCLGGRSFGNGVFSTFSEGDLGKWRSIVSALYPEYEGDFCLFGYNWLGQCYVINPEGTVDILIVETVDTACTDIPFREFLNKEIPSNPDNAVLLAGYHAWLKAHAPAGHMKCAGYKVPLFLGGEDNDDNMELVDMEVYWDMTTQIWEAVKDLPEGTKIGDIRFE